MAVIRKYAAGIVIDHAFEQDIVVTPGDRTPDVVGRFERFDLMSSTWSSLTSMLFPRGGHQQITYQDSVFVFGGTNGNTLLSSAEEYDIVSDEWTQRTDMPTARCFFSAAQDTGGNIYCVGGITADAFGNTSLSAALERYDPVTDEWTVLADLPAGVAFAVAHIVSGKLILLSGYYNELLQPSSHVLTYDISGDSWTDVEITDADTLDLYRRLCPFSFVKGQYIYVIDGILYEKDITQNPPPISEFYIQDSYRYDTTGETVARGDLAFDDLPKPRYNGCTASIGNDHYFLGGTNNVSNTLRFFETIDTSTSPFAYTSLTKMPRGRSSFAVSAYSGEYGEAIYSSGGIISNQGENFLSVVLNTIPANVHLDGKETASVTVECVDENGDPPSSDVQVRLSTISDSPILFAEDQITVRDGFGIATLLPRADDGTGDTMENIVDRSYGITVKGSIVDSTLYGETDSLPPAPGGGTGPTTSGGGGRKKGELSGAIELKRYDSVVHSGEEPEAAFVLGELGGIISLTPTSGIAGKDTALTFFNNTPWLPVVNPIIDDNEGTYDRMVEALDRMSRQEPYGGTIIIDALMADLDVIEFEVSGFKKLIYLESDGEDNNSSATVQNVIDRSGTGVPIVSSVFRVIPSNLHLDQGIRDGSGNLEELAGETGGSANYVVTDEDVTHSIETLLISKGFVGSGLFSCEIDLSDEVRIESITPNFSIPDAQTSAFWRFSIGDREHNFSILSDRIEANDTLTLFKTEGRYLRFVAEFFAEMTADTYNAETITPPRLESIDIVYHDKTTSYIYLYPTETDDQVHNIVITLDAQQSSSNSINVGATSAASTTWEDFGSPAQPTVDNSTRIVIPIRKTLDIRERFSLEPLVNVDGFIFEAKYGQWAADSEVIVYNEDGDTVEGYRTFPHKGFVVFNERKAENFVIEIRNKPNLSVAAEIINRVQGEPVVITGAGYMYSTTAPKSLSRDASNILPEAINLLLLPQNPNANSLFRANYTYYDIKGRAEKGTVVRWYVNNTEELDIRGLLEWDNTEWKLAISGDTIYFSVEPKAADATGRIVRSVPVKLS